jgi:putative acyl-CoA dehydrogenase
MVASAAAQRAAVALALHHCARREAFGRRLIEQPAMRNVLADLALEHEGALALAMRVARALDSRGDAHEDALLRLLTPVGKYWVCKRTPQHAAEAMECIGGSGVMDDGPLARLYREAPVNAIWEGSGNVQCLDVLRAMQRTPDVVDALFAELGAVRGADRRLDRWAEQLSAELRDPAEIEFRARALVDRIALAVQAAWLVRGAPAAVADAFCASRLDGAGARQYGTLPCGVDAAAIVARAAPHG